MMSDAERLAKEMLAFVCAVIGTPLFVMGCMLVMSKIG